MRRNLIIGFLLIAGLVAGLILLQRKALFGSKAAPESQVKLYFEDAGNNKLRLVMDSGSENIIFARIALTGVAYFDYKNTQFDKIFQTLENGKLTLVLGVPIINRDPATARIQILAEIETSGEIKFDIDDSQIINKAGFIMSLTGKENKLTFEGVQASSDLEGKLIVRHVDFFQKKTSDVTYQLLADGKIVELDQSQVRKSAAKAGDAIRLNRDKTISLLKKYNKSIERNHFGEQRMLVVPVDFPDNANMYKSLTHTMIREDMDFVNNYYQSMSSTSDNPNIYFKIDFINEWITYPNNISHCSGINSFLIDDQLFSKGISLDDWDDIVYIFYPPEDCKVEASGSYGPVLKPARAMINFSPSVNRSIIRGVIIHEVGHNLGIAHANNLNCGNKTIDLYNNCIGEKAGIEFGDIFDVMGFGIYSDSVFPINASFRSMMGWHNVQDVNSDGEYSISPLESVNYSVPQIIRVPKPDSNEFYYFSYRQKVGIDRNLPLEMTNGLIAHIGYIPEFPSRLLDLTPGDNNVSNSSLWDGGTFYDQINKIRVDQITHDSNGVKFKIAFNALPPIPSPTPDLTILCGKLKKLYDCDNEKNCAWYACSSSCWPKETPIDIACPIATPTLVSTPTLTPTPTINASELCKGLNLTNCDYNGQYCAWYACSSSCWSKGTPEVVACPRSCIDPKPVGSDIALSSASSVSIVCNVETSAYCLGILDSNFVDPKSCIQTRASNNAAVFDCPLLEAGMLSKPGRYFWSCGVPENSANCCPGISRQKVIVVPTSGTLPIAGPSLKISTKCGPHHHYEIDHIDLRVDGLAYSSSENFVWVGIDDLTDNKSVYLIPTRSPWIFNDTLHNEIWGLNSGRLKLLPNHQYKVRLHVLPNGADPNLVTSENMIVQATTMAECAAPTPTPTPTPPPNPNIWQQLVDFLRQLF